MFSFSVTTHARDELINITGQVERAAVSAEVQEGICVVYTPHTTAAITINENADPDVCTDMTNGLNALGFEKLKFLHNEGNSPAHIKSSLIGCSETLLISKGKLIRGTWQGIYLCEFDGPRTRTVHIMIK